MMTFYYYWLATTFTLTLLLLNADAKTRSPSCAGLDDLLARTNTDELFCSIRDNCIGIQCASLDPQFRIIVDLTRVTLLPCTNNTPPVLFELLGMVDPLSERRTVVFSAELTGDVVIPLEINTIPFGNVNVTFGLLEQDLIEFALQRYDEEAMETIPLINSTSIRLDLDSCPRQTETTTTEQGTDRSTISSITTTTTTTTTMNGAQTTLLNVPLWSVFITTMLSLIHCNINTYCSIT